MSNDELSFKELGALIGKNNLRIMFKNNNPKYHLNDEIKELEYKINYL